MLLTSGAVGMKAGNNQEADKIIEAMSKGIEFKQTDQKTYDTTAKEAIDRGKDQQDLTKTAIRQAHIEAENVQLSFAGSQADFIQKAFSAKAGSAGTGQNVAGSKLLRGISDDNTVGGSNPTTAAAHGLSRLVSNVGAYGGGAVTSMKEQILGPGTQPDLGGQGDPNLPALGMSPAVQASQAKLGPDGLPMNGTSGTDNRPFFPMLGAKSSAPVTSQTGTGYVPAGGQVGAAVSTKSPEGSTAGGGTSGTGTKGGTGSVVSTGAGMGGPIPVTLVGGALTMNLTGACPHCKAPITTSLQSQATNVAANTGSAH